MRNRHRFTVGGIFLTLIQCYGMWSTAGADLSEAVVVIRSGDLPNAERAATTVLVEELEKRTGIRLPTSTEWPTNQTVIAISSEPAVSSWGRRVPSRSGTNLPETQTDGYRLYVEEGIDEPAVVWILGADPRGTLYGVGSLLRHLDWSDGQAQVATSLDITTSPVYPIRGHQLGFRARANSWDAWTPEQFDQYIRELTFFGVNSIENIPFQDDRKSPLMVVSRREMNREMSEICDRYGLDYWVWTPADYDLNDAGAWAQALDQHEQLYRDCRQLTGVFFPGGDPGHNPPELVLPFLEDIANRLLPIHPNARVWLSLQWFNRSQIETIREYLESEAPTWLGGLVAGPSSPPIPFTRALLPKQYQFRLYPDITHNKICQYPVPWWDQAYALTLGREAINPRPAQYAAIHNWFAPYSDGFISYSDGVHDDVNKTIWSALGWDPDSQVRDILSDYARVYLHPSVAEKTTDGILALEKNWRGPLVHNGAVEGTLKYWQNLEETYPDLMSNWRWQMCLVRAYYDAYIRHRLLSETQLEEEANTLLAEADSRGADVVMREAMDLLNHAVMDPVSPELRSQIVELCELLFQSCGLQTSIEKHHASGAERGAFLDFIDYPMNNRWWLEDEFKRIAAFDSESEKIKRLQILTTWEQPGSGSYYDDVGNTAKSPHVLRSEDQFRRPGEETSPTPTLWWWDQGKSRARLSWQTTMNWPKAVVYEGLDPDATYRVRLTGYGKFLMRLDEDLVEPDLLGKEMGEFTEFPVPSRHIQDRKLRLTWDQPTDEAHLNWRHHSRLSEVWLLKN